MSWPTTIGSLPRDWFPPVHDVNVADAAPFSASTREDGVVLATDDAGGRDERSLECSWTIDGPAAAVFREHRERYAGLPFLLLLPGETVQRLVRYSGPVRIAWRSNLSAQVSVAVELAHPLIL